MRDSVRPSLRYNGHQCPDNEKVTLYKRTTCTVRPAGAQMDTIDRALDLKGL